jgi:hypothetical protein
MSSPITRPEDLEHVVGVLFSTPNDDLRAQADSIMSEWQSQLQCIPLSVHILQTSANHQTAFVAASTVHARVYELDEGTLDLAFSACLNRLQSPLNQPDSPAETMTVRCLATIACRFPQMLESYHSLTHRQVLLFFDFVFGRLIEVGFEPTPGLYDFAARSVPALLTMLRNSPIDGVWFSLHRSVLITTPEFPMLFPLLDQVRIASRHMALLPGVLSFLEAVLKFEPINLSVDQLRYVADVMIICVECAMNLMNQTPTDPIAVGAASFIWSSILEYGVDFYAAPDLAAFSASIFTKFLQNLSKFRVDLDELDRKSVV